MVSISLKDHVQKVVAGEWKAFAERHPHLAEVIDQTLVVEQAMASLADDPEFRKAMDAATVTGAMAEVIAEVVERFVQGWLKKLI